MDFRAKRALVEDRACPGVNFRCGFASDVLGNWLSEDDQKRKVEFVVETAAGVA